MKTRIQFAVAGCLVAMALVAGCGPGSPGTIAPMSGKLTLDGKPMADVEIVFSPKAVEGIPNPGPWSAGTTDAEGNYELITRYGEKGAAVGMHNVTMDYDDVEPGAMEQLQADLSDAKSSGENLAEVKAEIAALKKKLGSRPMIPRSANGEYEVPAGGNRSANFDLKSE